MFIDVTEVANHPESGETMHNIVSLNIHYIGAVFQDVNGNTVILVDKNILQDGATIVLDPAEIVMKKIARAIQDEATLKAKGLPLVQAPSV